MSRPARPKEMPWQHTVASALLGKKVQPELTYVEHHGFGVEIGKPGPRGEHTGYAFVETIDGPQAAPAVYVHYRHPTDQGTQIGVVFPNRTVDQRLKKPGKGASLQAKLDYWKPKPASDRAFRAKLEEARTILNEIRFKPTFWDSEGNRTAVIVPGVTPQPSMLDLLERLGGKRKPDDRPV